MVRSAKTDILPMAVIVYLCINLYICCAICSLVSVPSYRALTGRLILTGFVEKQGLEMVSWMTLSLHLSPNIFVGLHRIMLQSKFVDLEAV